MEWLIIAFVALLIVAFLLKGKIGPEDETAYRKQGPLFTPAERSFYGVLQQACGDKALIFGKVRVADILTPAKGQGRSGWQKAFNKIAAKHFDFVLCQPDDLSVIAAIELNDGSHKKRSRADRDAFLQAACESAGLPLHPFDAKHAYQIAEVRQVLFPEPLAEQSTAPEAVAETVPADKEPAATDKQTCPKCGSELVKKVASKGKHQGREFLACSGFPVCRHIEKAEA